MTNILCLFKELATQSNFKGDWYGWLTNQVSHASLGVFLTWIACVICYIFIGDLPYKFNVFTALAFAYIVWELVIQEWAGWDSVEDFLFVIVYGVGGTLLAFSQIVGPTVIFNVFGAMPIFSIFVVHLILGVCYRAWRQYGR